LSLDTFRFSSKGLNWERFDSKKLFKTFLPNSSDACPTVDNNDWLSSSLISKEYNISDICLISFG